MWILGLIQAQNPKIRQFQAIWVPKVPFRTQNRGPKIRCSNSSSIHGTETTSYPASSLSENDTSNQRESDQISEPVARPEIRRMTPSDDVEPEVDDLHGWYTAHAEIEENGNISQLSASSMQRICLRNTCMTVCMTVQLTRLKMEKIGSQSHFDPESDNLQRRTNPIEASESPESENTAVQHLHTVTEASTKTAQDGEFGSVSGSKSPNFANCEFGPVSGSESPQKTNLSEFRPNSSGFEAKKLKSL